MNSKNTHWIQRSLTAVKMLITALTLIIYFHYFNHQSWGYFTINPKQPLINIYTVSRGGTVSKDPALKNNMSYGMGISRKGIFLYNKLADIIAGDKDLVWKKWNQDSLLSLAKTANNIPVINYSDFNIGRGRFIITKTGRIPFDAINEKKKDIVPIVFTIIDVR